MSKPSTFCRYGNWNGGDPNHSVLSGVCAPTPPGGAFSPPKLLDQVVASEEIVIARHSKPIAKLSPVEAELPPRQPGALKGRIWIADNFDEFDDRLRAASTPGRYASPWARGRRTTAPA